MYSRLTNYPCGCACPSSLPSDTQRFTVNWSMDHWGTMPPNFSPRACWASLWSASIKTQSASLQEQ